MPAIHFLDDEAIEALTLGDDVVPELAGLAAFADHVRAFGDQPAPAPSRELSALFSSQAVTKADRAVRARRPRAWAGPLVAPRSAQERLAGVAAKVAGLGMAAKIALGVSVATAGVAGAGAAGVLPDGADRAVRSAIEAVTPLDLEATDGDDGPGGGSGGTSTTRGRSGEAPVGSGTTSGGPAGSAGAGGPAGEQPGPGAAGSAPGAAGAENSATEQEPNGQGGDRGERWDGDGVVTPESGSTPAATATTATTPTSLPAAAPDAPGDEGAGRP